MDKRSAASTVLLCSLALVAWVLPIVIWALNARGWRIGPAIPYGNDGHCDVWYYFGLATLGDHAWTLQPASRAISRIAAYLPNYALGRILPWNAAERHFLLFHTLGFIGALFAVRPLYGLATAALASALVSTSALWIAQLSTTYPTGAAVAYGMLAAACLANAVTTRRLAVEYSLCVTSGVLLAWAALVNLLAVIFFPFLPLLLLLRHDWRSRALGRDVVLVALGGLLGTILIGLGALAIGQPAMIFWYQILVAIKGIGDWWSDDLIRRSVVLPLAVGLSLALIAHLYKARSRRAAVVAAIVALTTITALMQTFIPRSQSFLYDVHYFMFLVPALLAIAELSGSELKTETVISIVAAALAGHVLLMIAITRNTVVKDFYLAHSMSMSVAAAAVLVVAALTKRRVLLLAAALVLFQVAAGPYMRAHFYLDPEHEANRLDVTEAALRFAREHGIPTRPVIWIASNLDADMATSLSRSFVRCRFDRTFPAGLPDPTVNRQPALSPGSFLVLVSRPDLAQEEVDRVLRSYGLVLADRVMQAIAKDKWSARITMGTVLALQGAGE